MIKYLFCDLDDTLIKRYSNGSKGINKYNLKAIDQLQRHGVKLVITTARSPFFLNKLMKQEMNYDYIAWNGAEIYIDRKLIATSYIDKEVFKDFIESYPDIVKDMRITLCNGTALYESKQSEAYRCFEQWGPVGKDYKKVKFISVKDDILNDEISDFHLFFVDKQEANKFNQEVMNSKFKSLFCFSRLGDKIFDVTMNTCNKGTAIKTYLKYIGQENETFAVIGDSENDIAMLEITKYNFCMKNGSKKALNISNYHVKNVAECIHQIIDINKMEN